MKNETLLVPVDGSSHSRHAVEYAVKVARHMGMSILVIHCHKPFPVLLGEPYYQKVVNKTLSKSNELLEPFRQMVETQNVGYDERVLEGDPGAKICQVAKIENCEMIVMGSRGLTDFRGLLLGSVAHRVVHAAPCPVLIVRGG